MRGVLKDSAARLCWGKHMGREDFVKPSWYFATHDHDIIRSLPINPAAAVLELGCGTGDAGRLALETGKAGRYVGIEKDMAAAHVAATVISEVVTGDIEKLDLSRFACSFDVLIASEVLEHLVDPWAALCNLVTCLKPGGMVFASSPNIAHWRVILDLARGRFRYAQVGVMDETHLRWFTPESYAAMFSAAGLQIERVCPVTKLRWKASVLDRVTFGRLRYLLMAQTMVIAKLR